MAQERDANTVRRGKRSRKSRETPAPEGAATQSKDIDRNSAIPEAVRERFTQAGNKYHFKDGALAFTDRGRSLTTPSENSEVIKSLIVIASSRGWSEITVKGTERFRRDAWAEGRLQGLAVEGYEPSAYEQARLAQMLAREARQPSDPSTAGGSVDEPPREPSRGTSREVLHFGRLMDHGPAPYRHDPKNANSYFVRLETPEGERELWGIDLRRALEQGATRPQVGDEIGVRAVRRDPVKVWAPQFDEEGARIGQKPVETHRNAWIVESNAFFTERAEAARAVRDPRLASEDVVERHPELAGTYLTLRAAELTAKRLKSPEDQTRFVNLVRRALADSIARGEPLPPVRLKEPQAPSVALEVEREPELTR